MMYYDGGHPGPWGWGLMAFGMVVFWGVLIVGAVLLIGSLRRTPGTDATRRNSPEELLAMRYAKGELDTEEYEARLATLHGTRRPSGTPNRL